MDINTETNAITTGEIEFDSLDQARDWLQRRGWNEKCGGGFWKGPEGFATSFSRRRPASSKTVILIEAV